MSDVRAVTVLYDGACPLCDREIAFYRSQPGAACPEWCDVSLVDDGGCAEGVPKEEALARSSDTSKRFYRHGR